MKALGSERKHSKHEYFVPKERTSKECKICDQIRHKNLYEQKFSDFLVNRDVKFLDIET